MSSVGKNAKKIQNLLASQIFFRLIIALSVLQGTWYALSFRPYIFDEGVHIGFIEVYTERLNPFISTQHPSLDFLGEITRNTSYLYYYLMSWPLRLINFLTGSEFSRIVFLRLLHVALFAGGLVLYRKVFVGAGASKLATNLALLFLILTPAIAPLNGAVNYDNAVFLLSGLLLLLAANIVKRRQVSFKDLSLLIMVGLAASLIKFEFLALFAPVAIYVGYDLWQKHRAKTMPLILKSYRQLSVIAKLVLVTGLLVSAALFVERPVLNFVSYHKYAPACTQLLSEARCSQNYTAQRDIMALAAKPAGFTPINPFNYLLQEWLPGMVTTQTILPPTQLSSALLRLFYYLAALGGGVLVFVYLREFIKKPAYKFLLFVTLFYTVALFCGNYLLYVQLGTPVAITGRYLLPVMPIFILFVVLAVIRLFRQQARLLWLGLISSLLVFSQGGGVVTYLMAASSDMYWPHSVLTPPNTFFKNHLKTFVRLGKVN